jgi:hypothetical protein
MQQIRMTKEGSVKLVDLEAVKEALLADGWVVEGEETPPARRGRPRKEETEE